MSLQLLHELGVLALLKRDCFVISRARHPRVRLAGCGLTQQGPFCPLQRVQVLNLKAVIGVTAMTCSVHASRAFGELGGVALHI